MKKSTLIHLPLQYFAEGGEASTSGSTEPTDGATSTDGGDQTAQPSFDDLLKSNKDLQAEFDRRMTKAQSTAIANAKTEWEKQAQAEKEEAARVAKMNADEKARHEQEKRDKAIADREAAIAKRELVADAKDKLTEKGLPVELHRCLDYSSAETVESSMEEIGKAFAEAVSKQVDEKLKNSAPPTQTGGGNSSDPFLAGLGL